MNKCYLVADDSLFARMLIKEAIKLLDNDASFIEAESGAQVLDAAQKCKYAVDWYLLDINMGEPDGVFTAESLIDSGVAPNQIALVSAQQSIHVKTQADKAQLRYIDKAASHSDVDGFVTRLQQFFMQ